MGLRFFTFLACGTFLFLTGGSPAPATAAEPGRTPEGSVNPDLSMQVESSEEGGWVTAEVYGRIDIPYTELKNVLADPPNWCEFIPLTLNTKACVCRKTPEGPRLTFFAGRKFYQPPRDAYELNYSFSFDEPREEVFRVLLTAEEGPVGTEDYRIEVLAFPYETGSLLHFSSSYRPSLRSRLLRQGYLATLGRDKVGFTVTDRTPSGEPVYVQGVRGIIERSAMRYYLALKAYLKTRGLPREERFPAALKEWFAMTEDYPRQLYEIPREEYLDAKRRERLNQEALQLELGSCRMEGGSRAEER